MWHWLTGLPWTGIGTAIAAITGTGAFAVAVLERRVRLKDQYGNFGIKRVGNTDNAGDGQPAEVYEFWYHGTGTATIADGVLFYGVTAYLTEQRRVPGVMNPGHAVLLNLRSDDFDAAFIVVIWVENRSAPARMRWYPLEILSPLAEELDRQIEYRRWRALRSRLQLGIPRVVGPGGVHGVQLTTKQRARGKQISKLLPGPPTSRA
jgi:hypothetical protein